MGVEIGELCPIPTKHKGQDGVVEDRMMMVCEGCMNKVRKNFEEQVRKVLRFPPDDLGGGAAVPKQP